MTARDRGSLVAIAADLLAGDRPTRRAAALGRMLNSSPRAAVTVDELAAAPAWLRMAAADRRSLGQRAALAAIAPALAATIDGRWLGGLAGASSDAALDWAISVADSVPMQLAVFDGSALGAVAAGLLRAAAPAGLEDFAAVPGAAVPAEPATAAVLVALAHNGGER